MLYKFVWWQLFQIKLYKPNRMIENSFRLGDSSTACYDSTKPKQMKLDNYTICADVVLGTGSFSTVYLCKNGENKAAVKVLNKNRKKSDNIIKVAKAEVKIIRKLKHANIVGFLGSYESENNYYILFQYCEGKTLRQLLNQYKTLDIESVYSVARGLVTAICYMNQRRVMHRDIKPDNVKYWKGKPTLIDFGFACELPNGEKSILHQSVGTPSYMSPEMLQRKNYSYKSDFWSLGILLYEIVYGRLPWNGKSQAQLLSSITKNSLHFPSTPVIPNQLKKLIEGCLQKKYSERIDMKILSEYKRMEYHIIEGAPKYEQPCSLFCWLN